jgi:hypothetical protein
MGPMANPHNLAPPGTVFVHGTTQDYGDRGSNMPHLKLQLRAPGLLDTGLKPQLIARLQLSDAGQSPTTDWTAFDGRDSTDLDAGARVYSALDLPAAVAVLQTSPAFATSFGAEPAVLTAHVPALGAPDDAIALRWLDIGGQVGQERPGRAGAINGDRSGRRGRSRCRTIAVDVDGGGGVAHLVSRVHEGTVAERAMPQLWATIPTAGWARRASDETAMGEEQGHGRAAGTARGMRAAGVAPGFVRCQAHIGYQLAQGWKLRGGGGRSQ